MTPPSRFKSAMLRLTNWEGANGSRSSVSRTTSNVLISKPLLGGMWQYSWSRRWSAASRARCVLLRVTSKRERWRSVASSTSSLQTKRKEIAKRWMNSDMHASVTLNWAWHFQANIQVNCAAISFFLFVFLFCCCCFFSPFPHFYFTITH